MKIQINKPCTTSTSQMQVNVNGYYCNECKKQVTDLSAMTDEQVLNHIAKNGIGCIALRADQIDREIIPARKQRFNFKLIYLSLIGFLFVKQPAQSQLIKPAYERLAKQDSGKISFDTCDLRPATSTSVQSAGYTEFVRVFGTGNVSVKRSIHRHKVPFIRLWINSRHPFFYKRPNK